MVAGAKISGDNFGLYDRPLALCTAIIEGQFVTRNQLALSPLIIFYVRLNIV